jgi:hypothetical protein
MTLPSANNFIAGYTTTAVSGTTTTLTVNSNQQQLFTGGSGGQVVLMPVASTLTLGQSFTLYNFSTGTVTVEASGGVSDIIAQLPANTYATFICILTSGVTAASWSYSYLVNVINGTTNQVNVSATTGNVTLSLPQSIATTSNVTFANITSTNNILGYTTTVTSSTQVVLTVTSNYQQWFTGSAAQPLTMPVASTLVVGQSWLVVNLSSAVVTIQSSGSNTILALPATSTAIVTCTTASGTTAASWNAVYFSNSASSVSSITGTANQVIASASTGAVTLSLPQSIATTSAVTFASTQLSNTGILDTNGNVAIALSATASAVNGITVTNAASGSSPIIAASGTGTNISLTLQGKGTSGVPIKGVTDASSANAGYVGEIITSNVTVPTTGLTTNQVLNITSVSLTAGDWILYGYIGISGANTTTITEYEGGIHTANTGLPTIRHQAYGGGQTFSNLGTLGFATPTIHVTISSTTSYYLNAEATFLTSTAGAGGNIIAIRTR